MVSRSYVPQPGSSALVPDPVNVFGCRRVWWLCQKCIADNYQIQSRFLVPTLTFCRSALLVADLLLIRSKVTSCIAYFWSAMCCQALILVSSYCLSTSGLLGSLCLLLSQFLTQSCFNVTGQLFPSTCCTALCHILLILASDGDITSIGLCAPISICCFVALGHWRVSQTEEGTT